MFWTNVLLSIAFIFIAALGVALWLLIMMVNGMSRTFWEMMSKREEEKKKYENR